MKVPFFFDQDVSAVFLHRLWQAFFGVVTLLAISHFLTPKEQGIYYTFASIAAIQTILDMGLSVALVQMAAYKFSGMRWEQGGRVVGERSFLFFAFVKCAILWYGIATLLFFLIYPLGLLFFSSSPEIKALQYPWQPIWLILILFTGFNLFLQPLLSVIEGSGQVMETYKLRLLQTVLGAFAAWIAFFVGYGLIAVCMLPLISVVITVIWLLSNRRHFLTSVFRTTWGGFSWFEEVWPLQWRIGVSWVCGYFLTQLYTTILFKTQGAVAAGQMGLSITIINMIGLIALSIMTAKIPLMGQLASKHQRMEVDMVFRKGLAGSLILYCFGGIVILCILYLLANTEYSVRFLPWNQFLILMIAILAANVVNTLAMFFRAYRQERLMWLYVANALLASSLSYVVAPCWGSAGIVASLFLINVFFILPIAVLLWLRFRLVLLKP